MFSFPFLLYEYFLLFLFCSYNVFLLYAQHSVAIMQISPNVGQIKAYYSVLR